MYYPLIRLCESDLAVEAGRPPGGSSKTFSFPKRAHLCPLHSFPACSHWAKALRMRALRMPWSASPRILLATRPCLSRTRVEGTACGGT